ncbi:MAG: 16S rRNA (guanine(966)-N(2))-methyltransferase RsmD [Pseudanabaena sp. CRU_2_10]|nr:16S rRNA (guanine(966)-N(2))-methyltransferase RsmD [Pseudanabaena sp. CRU_2_10]
MALRVYGDRLLKTLPGLATRPTPSRVREALFNIWQSRVQNCRWLDLCTGSGAMAAEALLRGAASAVGIEQSGSACKLIKQNLQNMIKPTQAFSIHRGDVLKVIPKLQPQKFDLVYFDPPYQSDWYELAIAALPPLLTDDATVAVEHDRARLLADVIGDLVAVDRRKYGQTAIAFYELDNK